LFDIVISGDACAGEGIWLFCFFLKKPTRPCRSYAKVLCKIGTSYTSFS